ncbi:hypothetical protein Pan216_55910 [Planctomycetes bacterium Pan216]|uniref:SHOCT domain-containing protein n=1 Tax=Kolteria novifilia TaxID=2527975 RepID=A0A518BCJ1_9BACT|nr:hypothetical protein Pan216_55910 [Planctomycetes bacterium Pan216]
MFAQAVTLDELWPAILTFLIAAGVILVLVVVILLIRRWYHGLDDDGVSASDMMTGFRDMKEQGGLSDEEFKLIKGHLRDKLRSEIDKPSSSDESSNESS